MPGLFWVAAFGFVLGIASGSLVALALPYAALACVLGAFLAVLHYAGYRSVVALFVSISLLSFGAGLLRVALEHEFVRPSPELGAHAGRNVLVEGVVSADPDERVSYTNLTVKLASLNGEEVSGKLLIRTDRYPQFSYGDTVRARGRLEQPEPFSSENGRQFDYPNYLAKDGIFFLIPFAQTELVTEGGGNPVTRALYATKHAFLNSINRMLPEPESSLLSGLLLGTKHSLGEDVEEAFRRAGVIHLVVLSGYNVTIVAEWTMRALGFLPRTFNLLGGGLGIVLFVAMAGAPATAVRAGLMALVVILGRALRRSTHLGRALTVAGIVMLLVNPHILLYDPSFQLSFLATAGLIAIAPRLSAKLLWVPERFGLRDIVAATIATQLAVLPLLVYQVGSVSLIALLANLCILIAVPAAMFLGLGAAVIGLVLPTLAQFAALPGWGVLHYIIAAAEGFGSVPFAAVSVPPIPGLAVLAAYAAGALALWYFKSTAPARLSDRFSV